MGGSSERGRGTYEALSGRLGCLRRVERRRDAEGEEPRLVLAPESKGVWSKERSKCEGTLVEGCVEENRTRCAIRSRKVCTAVRKGAEGGARTILGKLLGQRRRPLETEASDAAKAEGNCEDKVFGACVVDLERVCSEKARTACGRAFEPHIPL
ncbi:hypothetical protein HOP50_04g30260 [Chloropicon primus]|uniref:Uncharacterized protein n=1 Tax=Chloropicon primus TaxID=1764295 RepID=A0A5B8MIQ7_9CHLO|nr:hypothetical protein A3770_04p30260 [Chloropicon primus]UPQ99718.1 hypothetical protein HOP50_04g30260 [Chloropicon primus]|mmetsp:Transcript_3573/g.10090  ORF Transcript_3573/g.10090 Transcript_3573/m.10090 type:complete len:154 (+) Transcript_3573:140-601(+)|eukprot:QDZ20508.1 hypothetical protein A3770_04p30260 [Chloropicon primus]